MHALVLVNVSLLTKFEVPSFTCSKDVMGLENLTRAQQLLRRATV